MTAMAQGPVAGRMQAQGGLRTQGLPQGQDGLPYTSSPNTSSPYASDEFTGELVCTAVTPVTCDVSDFSFRAASGALLPFTPGQYYTFRFDSLGEERCYSISSAPEPGVSAAMRGVAAAQAMGAAETLTITVKRIPGGPVSTYLHDELRVGDVLRADGPYGIFGTDVRPGAHALYLSAGSGITPFLSMMRSRSDTAAEVAAGHPVGQWASVVHVHSARTPADIVHRAELSALSGYADTTVIPVCSGDAADEPWYGIRGRITAEKLINAVPDVAEREVFVCGPTGYTQAVYAMLAELGVPDRWIHTESYVFGQASAMAVPQGPAREDAPGDATASGVEGGRQEPTAVGAEAGGAVPGSRPLPPCFSVEFRGAGRTVECPAGTTLLEAAQAAGIPHPSSCAEGVCGTCKSVKVSGEVEMDHAGGIRPREVREGKILPCCSVPLTDIVME